MRPAVRIRVYKGWTAYFVFFRKVQQSAKFDQGFFVIFLGPRQILSCYSHSILHRLLRVQSSELKYEHFAIMNPSQ
jgi:hypothetical protein